MQVDEEESWIREKEPLASSADYGRDVKGVIKLQQKHQALEAEIQGEVAVSMLVILSVVFVYPSIVTENDWDIDRICVPIVTEK